MYLNVNKKKLEVIELISFWERFKELKFDLKKLDYVAKFPNRKIVTTVFLCQRVDIIMTNKDDVILYLYTNVKSEKYFLPKFNVRDVYFLPANSTKEFKVGDKLIFSKK